MTLDALVDKKRQAEEGIYQLSLTDPDFVRFKCDPQTLSFMSDIAFQLRKLYPEMQADVKDVLDVGARTGIGSWFLKNLHHPDSFSAVRMHVTAVDIEGLYKSYSEAMFPEIDYLVADIFNLPDNSRDIVICSHTIEHVPNPTAFVQQLCNLAREYVVIACPFEEPADNLIPGHLSSINQAFIDQFSPSLLAVYTSMHWHQSQACIFAIDTRNRV